MRRTYVLYGVALRDPSELVCMFFGTKKDRAEFERDLPGRYERMTIKGANLMRRTVRITKEGGM